MTTDPADPARTRTASRPVDVPTASHQPIMARFDQRQRDHTREDLAYLLRFADAALLVNDPTVLVDVIQWLDELLQYRGLPPGVMGHTLQALHTSVGADLPIVRAWLELAGLELAPWG